MGLASPLARAVLAVSLPYLASERSALHALVLLGGFQRPSLTVRRSGSGALHVEALAGMQSPAR